MATYSKILMLMMATLIIAGEMKIGSAQNCGCKTNLCCSQYGYCGTTDDYCGIGCQQGPCKNAPTPTASIEPIESFITPDFFKQIESGISASCEGTNSYTYDAFIRTAKASNFAGFGTTGSLEVRKRELAAFFANFAHETGINLCNMGNAERADNAFTSLVGFWMMGSKCHEAMTSTGEGAGFGGTIRAINARECDGGRPSTVKERVRLYTEFCKSLDVAPGPNLTC